MKRQNQKREMLVYEHSKKNRWYEYERYKKHLSSPNREAEAKSLSKNLRI